MQTYYAAATYNEYDYWFVSVQSKGKNFERDLLTPVDDENAKMDE